ncbi:unnamed protein product [Soboliphyme baturini]|uniref:LAM_G_DOMAIN domain-containing protein n=1 Tax=Soboliphyme baturini TaxID=241478 RepID=A0A183J882_9BILA|nr:unnamed protein product [Soboliphyme baturini]
MVRARDSLSEVRKQAMRNDQHVNDLNYQLSFLKEKIKEVREKASKVKLSVKSDEAGCLRSYLSPAAPSVSNELHIAYRPLDGVPDSLLFITQTDKTRTRMSEYLAVELRNRQIIFLWNIGDGDQMVTNLKQIRSVARKDRNSWYLIDVKSVYSDMHIKIAREYEGLCIRHFGQRILHFLMEGIIFSFQIEHIDLSPRLPANDFVYEVGFYQRRALTLHFRVSNNVELVLI